MRKIFDLKYLERRDTEELFQYALKVPLFFVVAAMGYGKTTLVRDFLDKQKNKKVVWLSLGENEVDEVWMWQRLCEKFREENIPIYEQMENLGLPTNAREIEVFIHMLKEICNQPFFLIFDDYHECKSRYFNQLVLSLTYEEIANLHIGIISRIFPEIPYEQLWMKGYCVLIEQDEMVLKKKEIKEFFEINGEELCDEELDILFDYTDGWMSAVYLSFIEYKRNKRLEGAGNIANLLKVSIYDKLPEKLKELIMMMSLFDTFTAPQAAYITKIDFSSNYLCNWARKIGFVKVDSINETFQLHTLLKAVALMELDKSGIDKKLLYDRCADWYWKKGDLIHGISYYQKSENTQSIFRIMEQNNFNELYLKAPQIIKGFFRSVDRLERLNHSKAYFLFINQLIIGEDYQEGIILYEEAKNFFENEYKGSKRDEILGELLFIEAMVRFNNLERMTQCIKNAYQLVGRRHSMIFNSQEIFTYGVPEIITLYHYEVGKLKDVLKLEKEYTYYYMRFVNGVDGGWDSLFDAEYQYTIGNIQKAQQLAELACEKAKFRKQACIIISAYFVLMRCDIYLGQKKNLERKREELAREMEGESRSYIIMDYDMTASYIDGCIGRSHKMAGWIQNFQMDVCNSIVRSVRGGCVSYGIYLKHNKKWLQLEALAEQMLIPYRLSKHIYPIINAWIFKAIAAYHLYDADTAAGYLERGLKIACPDGIVMPFVERADELEPILLHVKEKDGYILKLLDFIKKYKKGVLMFQEEKKLLLTEREAEFMELVIKGYKNSEISKSLNIALVTVEKTLTNIYRKLNVANRIAAASKFQELKKE